MKNARTGVELVRVRVLVEFLNEDVVLWFAEHERPLIPSPSPLPTSGRREPELS